MITLRKLKYWFIFSWKKILVVGLIILSALFYLWYDYYRWEKAHFGKAKFGNTQFKQLKK